MDRTPTLLRVIEPHLPKMRRKQGTLPGGIELYLNTREWRLLLRTLKRALPAQGRSE